MYLSGFDKRYLQKFQVRFNNLTFEVNKKQLKVASYGLKTDELIASNNTKSCSWHKRQIYNEMNNI